MNTVDKLRLCPCIKRIVSVPKYISQGIRSWFVTKRKYFEGEIQWTVTEKNWKIETSTTYVLPP